MAGELGKASLDLEANLGPYERNVTAAEGSADRLKRTLDALALAGDVARRELNDIKMSQGQGVRSRITAEEILSGVRGIKDESRDAALELDRVHLSETQAAETVAAGAVIDHELDNIESKAHRVRLALDGVRLRLAAAGGGKGGIFGGRPGVGPFGAGYGRLGGVGTLIGIGAVTAPAAAPGAAGLLAAIPALAAAGVGALGTLILAFRGVGKAIGGDKKAFDALTSSQKEFVQTVRGLHGFLDRLKQISAQSLFPGLTMGLKAALSPGTVNAIETALVQLGHALGAAGAQWGRYFGSPRFQQVFGPLMQSAARTIGRLSDAFLHLFDAFGVIARAAIPFTNWLNTAIDRGAKFADTWLRARDATGQLGGAMREAQASLKLVGGLALALLKVVFQLGAALYPVAKVAVKDLTDGLNALAGIIGRNKAVIREVIGTALTGLKVTVAGVAKVVGFLVDKLSELIGPKKARIVAAITAIGVALAVSLGPESAAILGALFAIGLIVKHWGAVKRFFVNLGHEIVNAFKYAWYLIKKGALKAALAVVEPFSHLPSFLGGWARKAKDSMQHQLNKLHAPNMAWGGYAAKAGRYTGEMWRGGFLGAVAGLVEDAFKGVGAAVRAYAKHHHPKAPPKPGTHAWYMQNLGYDPTQGGDVFGPPPPFTKNTGGAGGSGKAAVIPASASHLLALASTQASIAANAKTLKKERGALEHEITDLEKADQILLAKWRHAHGKAKTELFNAITATQNKIRAARKKLRDAVGHARQSRLDYALAQAQVAVEHAKEGSKAWDRAIKAEEKALRSEIRYWDKVGHNMKLSGDARTAALRKELGYQKQLKKLLNQTKQAASANIAQFLSSWADIQNTFAPNAVPYQGAAPSGKTDTHLHDLKNEARESNRHLKAIRGGTRFPGSRAGFDAAMAVS